VTVLQRSGVAQLILPLETRWPGRGDQQSAFRSLDQKIRFVGARDPMWTVR